MDIELSFADTMERVGMPFIKLTVNDHEGYFLLDTGANNSHIDGEFAKEIGAKEVPGEVNVITSMLGDSAVAHSYSVAMTFGNLCLTDVVLSEASFAPVNESLKEYSMRMHGIIGMSFMRMLHGYIDLDSLTLTLRLSEIEQHKQPC